MISDILNEGYQVTLRMKGKVEVENGVPDQRMIRDNEDKLLKFVTDYLRNEFIEKTKAFPKNGLAEIDLMVDMVVMKGEHYRTIKEIANQLDI